MRRARPGAQDFPAGARIFLRRYTRLGCRGRPPQFLVEFYPYAGFTHTIRLREGTAFVRLSDLLCGAPLEVLEAVAAILLGRLYRRKPPRALIETYRKFAFAQSTRRQGLTLRRGRARQIHDAPRGLQHDLGPLYDALNRRYFSGKLRRPHLAWSAWTWQGQLGSFDPALRQILINRRLDTPTVPRFVVAYVLYHEMLHQKHPLQFARCRLKSHSTEFRREEKRFRDYRQAVEFLADFA